jgi:plastocyanin
MHGTLRTLAVLTAAAAPLHAAELIATVRSAQGAPAADAVVVAVPVDGAARPAPKPLRTEVQQIDFEFVPRVKAIRVGTAVDFPNKDKAGHHVYSFSAPKRFEIPLYTGTPAPVVFDRPGVVVLGCNLRDWMIGYLYVADSPWFAQTGADGVARIANLPAGSYRLQVWHPLLEGGEEATRRQVTLGASESSQQAWQLALRPEIKIPRTRRPAK